MLLFTAQRIPQSRKNSKNYLKFLIFKKQTGRLYVHIAKTDLFMEEIKSVQYVKSGIVFNSLGIVL
jgi:hypothetical protein